MMHSRLGERYDPAGEHLDDPYPLYEQARRDEPVFYSPRLGAWVVTSYNDVDAVLRDPATFSSVNSLRSGRHLYPATVTELGAGYPPMPDHVTSDGEVHRRLRAPYAARLTAGAVRELEPGIHDRAAALVEAFAGDRRVELVSRFTSPLPVEVMVQLFGIAEEDLPLVKAGTEGLFRLGNVESTTAEAEAARQFVALQHLLAGYVRDRRSHPTDDLLSHVVAELAPGDQPLTFEQEAELVGTLSGTIGAGHVTVTHLIANTVRLLLTHPEQWTLLRQRPELTTNAVEEAMRFDAPVAAIFRRCTQATTIAGTTIDAGSDVLVVFASANRDESHFPAADRFDITRTPGRHFGFGAGPHTCVGAALARAEARVALQVLTEHLPQLRVVPDQTLWRQASIGLRGLQALELDW
jgi:cytochrome P450